MPRPPVAWVGAGRLASSPATSLKREATPASPTAPTQNVTNSAVKPAGAAPAAAAAPKRPWGAMLGGLAAGLGLAWLANSLGLGEAFGQIIMFALLAMVVMMAIGWFMRSRKPASNQNAAPFAFQGAGTGGAPVSDVKLYRPKTWEMTRRHALGSAVVRWRSRRLACRVVQGQ